MLRDGGTRFLLGVISDLVSDTSVRHEHTLVSTFHVSCDLSSLKAIELCVFLQRFKEIMYRNALAFGCLHVCYLQYWRVRVALLAH